MGLDESAEIIMKNYIKKILGISKLENDNECLKYELREKQSQINKTLDQLKEFARVDADIGFRGNNTIILAGVYRNKGYVQFYDMGDGEFAHLIEELKYRQKSALIRHIDKPAASFIGEFGL